jgi:hypothetical protein
VKLVELSGPKKWEYLKNKINELETNSKNKNIRDLYRGINEFKNVYQPRTNMVVVVVVVVVVYLTTLFQHLRLYSVDF